MVETTYSIPRWRYLSRGEQEPLRVLFRQARNAELGSRGEVMDGFDWRPLRAEERLVHDTVTRLPQVENDWVR